MNVALIETLLTEPPGARFALRNYITPSTPPHVVYTMPHAPIGPWRSGEEEDATQSPSPDAENVVVLVAEDEETIAETLAMIIEDVGYVAVLAHDGREALALARQHRPHLIITDLMMPYMSGADLITAVRGDAASQGFTPPPIVVITAASRARAEETGADAVITKPFDVAKVEAAMQRLLENDSR